MKNILLATVLVSQVVTAQRIIDSQVNYAKRDSSGAWKTTRATEIDTVEFRKALSVGLPAGVVFDSTFMAKNGHVLGGFKIGGVLRAGSGIFDNALDTAYTNAVSQLVSSNTFLSIATAGKSNFLTIDTTNYATATMSGFLRFSDFARLANTSGTNTGDVTLAGTPDYITISGQVITRGLIDLATDVTGDLPFANLTQGSALSVLGVAGNATADVASISASSDNQVLRRSGTTLGFGAVNLASSNAVTGDLPYANITPATSASLLLGRGSAAGAGDWQEITIGTGLSMSGTALSSTITQYTDEMAQDAVGAMVDATLIYTDATPLLSRAALTGDVTASAGSNTTTIANNAVTLAKMQDIATASFLGRNSAGTGDPEVLSIATAKSMLNLAGTNTGDQTITLTGDVTGSGTGTFTATISNDAVTYAKIQNVTDNRLLGRSAGSAGDVQEITIGSGLSLSGGQLSATGGSGITSLNGLTASSQSFADVDDSNVTLAISSATSTHTFTLGWTGLLAASRGGTGNGFFQVSGPATSTKTYTFPNASTNVLTEASAGWSMSTSSATYNWNNGNLDQVNRLTINDPGTSEGIIWSGNTSGNIELDVIDDASDNILRLAANSATSHEFRLTHAGGGSWSMTINGNTVWHAGNDGSGSGLDADLLDGNSSAAFQPAGNYITALTGDVTATGPGSATATVVDDSHAHTGATISALDAGDVTTGIFPAARGGTNNAFFQVSGPATSAKTFTFPNSNATVWTDVNDGSGSGLDADLLDGVSSGSFLRSDANDVRDFAYVTEFHNDQAQTFNGQSSNLNLVVYQASSGYDAFMTFHVAGDFAGYFGLGGAENDFVVGGWSYGNNRYKVWHAGNITPVPTSRTLTMTGTANQVNVSGGTQDLSANRTWTFSLPQNIHTGATPNFSGLYLSNSTASGNVAGGTYTPTLTGVSNVSSTTAYQCEYMRIGNVVHVAGQFDLSPTATGANSRVGISLPVASNIGAESDLSGTGQTNATVYERIMIRGDATNDRADFYLYAQWLGVHAIYFVFTYEVI